MKQKLILIIPRSVKEFKNLMKQYGKPYEKNDKNQYLITKAQYNFYQEKKEHKIKLENVTTGLSNISDSKFAEYHRNYLQSLSKPKKLGTFQGKYVLICFDENDSHDRKRHLMQTANGAKSVKKLLDLHPLHNYILLHQSRSKKYGIKRNSSIWREMS